MKPSTLCDKICLALRCFVADISHSYIYVRDNHPLELNDAMRFRNCGTCCCSHLLDHVRVLYSDREPFEATCSLASFPFVVPMPFETMPIPCCCCNNRVAWCDNCFGCRGPVSGNPNSLCVCIPQVLDRMTDLVCLLSFLPPPDAFVWPNFVHCILATFRVWPQWILCTTTRKSGGLCYYG